MGALIRDVLGFALGQLVPFSWVAWLLLTLLLAGIGAALVGAVPRLFEPIAVEVALRPGRIAWWLIISALGVPLLLAFLILTIVGAPFSVVIAFALLLGGVIGYLSVAYLAGDRISRALGRELPGWQAVVVGVLAFRIIRLIPIIGAPAHSMIAWVAFAATCAIGWDLVRSWWRRRLPDNVQFRDEDIIEWNPPEQ